MLKIWK